MKFSMTGKEKDDFNTGDCFIEVTPCAGLTNYMYLDVVAVAL